MIPNLHKRRVLQSQFFRVSVAHLFVCIGFAIFDAVWAVHLDSFLHNASLVGLVSGSLNLLALLYYIFAAPLLERNAQTRIIGTSLLGLVLGYVAFAFTHNIIVLLIVAVFTVFCQTIYSATLGVLVRDSSSSDELGSAEGIRYVMSNVGWLVGPLLGGFVIARYSTNATFLFSALFALLTVLMYRALKIRDFHHHKGDYSTLKRCLGHLVEFFRKKERLNAYAIAGGINIYWAIVYIYLPLVIIRNGLGGEWVGYTLFGVVVPLVLLEYPIGRVTNKHTIRWMFIAGYGIIAVFAYLAGIASSVFMVITFFIIASIGAAFIEGTRETYFFRTVSQEEENRFYGPFMTHTQVFSMLGKLIGGLVLFFLPMNTLFIIIGAIMGVYAIWSYTVYKV